MSSPSQNDPKPEATARPEVNAAGAATPPPPPPGYYPPPAYAPPKKNGGILSRLLTSFLTTVLIVSLVANVYMGVILKGMMAGPSETTYAEGDTQQRIVILPVEGLIDEEAYYFVRDSLKALRKNLPKAVVLRVDSGGGYVAPSDRIWNDIVNFKKDTGIPIIASFGSMAASGGYYIAAPADIIVAEPTTITGSIGVIAQAFTFERLLDKIGVTPKVIASSKSTKKDMLNPMREWTPEDEQKLRAILDDAYARFVYVVHEGRQNVLNEAQVRALATGEVFTAEVAHDRKLVDELGYLDHAIELAKNKAGIAADVTPQVTRMGRPATFSVLGMLHTDAPSFSASFTSQQARDWAIELAMPKMMYHVNAVE